MLLGGGRVGLFSKHLFDLEHSVLPDNQFTTASLDEVIHHVFVRQAETVTPFQRETKSCSSQYCPSNAIRTSFDLLRTDVIFFVNVFNSVGRR